MKMARDHFVEYLRGTLIPDCREAGSEGHADDYTEAVRHISNLTQALEVARATIERVANTPARLASVQGTLGIIAEALRGSTALSADEIAEFQ